ncbi:helix-turn-helix domain-containing protein [Halobacterium yunchengense]|uniref:helix-turn-helix domain-containing protein n=1 Tax=Halobacterium yunchengense TaxID=3108497 RepID=UPI00300B1050
MEEHTPADSSERVWEVEFHLHDSGYPFVAASAETDSRFELAEMVPRADGEYAEFFDVTGVSPERVAALVADRDTVDATLVTEYEDGGLFEFVVSGRCPAVELGELGALPREVEGVDGRGRIVAEIPPGRDPSVVVESFLAENPDAELAAKREKDGVNPLFADSSFRQVLRTHLTERQREVLRAAFEAGYYDWPRESTGSEVASELGITSATFSEHVHAAERKLLSVLFGGAETADGDDS